MTEYFSVLNHDRTLRGTLHVGNAKVPVIIVHGYFSANKIGVHRLYVQMANMLAKIGFSVLRIDLSGMGESDGEISDFNFADHVSDITSAAAQLMKHTGSSKVHYIGHCIGTCTALQSAMQNIDFVESLTLISPFMPSEANYIKLLFTEENYHELQTTGSTLRRGLICKKSFIDAGYIINKYPNFCNQNKIDSIIYFAENDNMVNVDEFSEWAIENHLRYLIIPGADHNFVEPLSRTELLCELEKRFHLLNKE